jgi:hypothetical protein
VTTEALPFQLEVIARSIEHWLEWDNGQRTSEGLTTEDGTHIMSLPVPVWPSHGMFRNWIAVLKAAAAKIPNDYNAQSPLPAPPDNQ